MLGVPVCFTINAFAVVQSMCTRQMPEVLWVHLAANICSAFSHPLNEDLDSKKCGMNLWHHFIGCQVDMCIAIPLLSASYDILSKSRSREWWILG